MNAVRTMKLALSAALAAVSALAFGACSGDDGASDPNQQPGDASSVSDAGWTPGDAGGDAGVDGGGDAGADAAPPPEPTQHAPCDQGTCWAAGTLSSFCGSSTVSEDFSSGKYNVHDYTVLLPAGVKVDFMLSATGGTWSPALIVNAQGGTTLYDGEVGASGAVSVTAVSSGKSGAVAKVSLTASTDTAVNVFVTSWDVVNGGFTPTMPTSATYDLKTDVDCTPPGPGTLITPPNFDPNNTQNGFYQLPESDPAGLYVRKGAACSWGTKLLIDVIYTVATQWKPLYPSLSPLSVRDMNENIAACGTNHATHDDGTHVDIVAGCATDINCSDKAPKIALAKLFVDTGVACGILNNDTAVHKTVNDYFAQKTNYAPWNGQFMRSVTGHTQHFHVRVKKPNGACN